MWKAIILSALFSVVQGTNIEDINGNYTVVMTYNQVITNFKPACLKFAVSEDSRNIQCSCLDGSSSTLVEFKLVERVPFIVNNPDAVSMPTLVVDATENLTSVLNAAAVSCKCAGEKFDERTILKYVNNNYVIIYNGFPTRGKITLLGRTLPNNSELEQAIAHIDEIKNKNGFKMCTQEIYEELRLSN